MTLDISFTFFFYSSCSKVMQQFCRVLILIYEDFFIDIFYMLHSAAKCHDEASGNILVA